MRPRAAKAREQSTGGGSSLWGVVPHMLVGWPGNKELEKCEQWENMADCRHCKKGAGLENAEEEEKG